MKNKSIVRICEDYVVQDQEEVRRILKQVSQIISKSYIRRMNEKCESVKVAVVS
jgi:glycine betaine/choline ABC-type transport system substrate-binding protein